MPLFVMNFYSPQMLEKLNGLDTILLHPNYPDPMNFFALNDRLEIPVHEYSNHILIKMQSSIILFYKFQNNKICALKAIHLSITASFILGIIVVFC